MELPHLGVHCAEVTCARLDFLPFTCDACHKIFCSDHQRYQDHHCTESYSKDVQVPVCPLCNQPVPINRGDDPNIKMDQHIQNDCQSEAAKKLYTNRCSFRGCKKKELVKVNCNTCRKVFCLKHRFETDHNCEGTRNRLGNASTHRSAVPHKPANKTPQSTTLSGIGAELNRERLLRQREQQSKSHSHSQPKESEDQALAAAMAASLKQPSSATSSPPPPQPQVNTEQYNEDEALARAIAASLQQDAKSKTTQNRQQSNDSCILS